MSRTDDLELQTRQESSPLGGGDRKEAVFRVGDSGSNCSKDAGNFEGEQERGPWEGAAKGL